MKDILAWFGLKRFPFDKNIKVRDVLATEPLKECLARLDYIKRRGGIFLLTGDPGIGKTLALRSFVRNLNENLFKTFYTPLSTLSRADLLCHINRLLGLPRRISKSALYLQIQHALLESKEQAGKTIVLIIDEAHLLQTGPLYLSSTHLLSPSQSHSMKHSLQKIWKIPSPEMILITPPPTAPDITPKKADLLRHNFYRNSIVKNA